jgi:tRNA pseudouridine32 synthase/23S rRNA pseudouridine746 synthase
LIPRLCESEDLLAVEKPAGLACIPGRDIGSPHVLGALQGESGSRLFVVHRLDTETSGVLVFAKTPEMHRWLSLQFQDRLVRKTYTALVHGRPVESSGRIDAPLRIFGSGRAGVDPERGKPSVTEFETLEEMDSFTLLAAYPLTGRQHQVRAHFYSIGHPVTGDRKYGDRAFQMSFPRLMLHSRMIELPMPDGQRLSLESPLPSDFVAVLEMARKSLDHAGEEAASGLVAKGWMQACPRLP